MNCKHNHSHNKKGYFQLVTAVPWCCALTIPILVISLFTAFLPIAALTKVSAFDEFFHTWLLIPALVIHLFGIIWYFGFDSNKTKKLTRLYIASSILFSVSMLFHFSPFHDQLFEVHETGHSQKQDIT